MIKQQNMIQEIYSRHSKHAFNQDLQEILNVNRITTFMYKIYNKHLYKLQNTAKFNN